MRWVVCRSTACAAARRRAALKRSRCTCRWATTSRWSRATRRPTRARAASSARSSYEHGCKMADACDARLPTTVLGSRGPPSPPLTSVYLLPHELSLSPSSRATAAWTHKWSWWQYTSVRDAQLLLSNDNKLSVASACEQYMFCDKVE